MKNIYLDASQSNNGIIFLTPTLLIIQMLYKHRVAIHNVLEVILPETATYTLLHTNILSATAILTFVIQCM